MQIVSASDPRLAGLIGSTNSRFQTLVDAAAEGARDFYLRVFGEPLSIEAAVARIFADVERDGDAALHRYGRDFDQLDLGKRPLQVQQAECDAAWRACPAETRSALELAAERIAAYQKTLLPPAYRRRDWQELDHRWTPLERVGAYVPGGAGGTLPLCSTVLMNVVPAKVAGVEHCVVVTPPRPDGSLAPELLAACQIAGVDAIYRVGGVQAIAALACGTESITAVDKIVGPGNLFVTLAKRHAYGRVDIDMLAGPSEILIIADDSVDPAWVAADLLSQAEHDPLAMAILLTTQRRVAEAVSAALLAQLQELPEARRRVAAASIENLGTAVVCADQAEMIELCDRFAPEHLELLCADAVSVAQRVRHAGAIFIGPYSPEPIGDYIAGPSHTLPTGGTARMWSGIGADTFLKRTSIIHLGADTCSALLPAAMRLAAAEGLEAHRRSLAYRRDGAAGD